MPDNNQNMQVQAPVSRSDMSSVNARDDLDETNSIMQENESVHFIETKMQKVHHQGVLSPT